MSVRFETPDNFCSSACANVAQVVKYAYVIEVSGQFAPDNSPPIFKQLAPRSFIHYRAKRDLKCMKPRLNAIEIILRSFIHSKTNYSSFFYPLPSLKFGGELSGANCPGGELSGIPFRYLQFKLDALHCFDARHP